MAKYETHVRGRWKQHYTAGQGSLMAGQTMSQEGRSRAHSVRPYGAACDIISMMVLWLRKMGLGRLSNLTKATYKRPHQHSYLSLFDLNPCKPTHHPTFPPGFELHSLPLWRDLRLTSQLSLLCSRKHGDLVVALFRSTKLHEDDTKISHNQTQFSFLQFLL